MTTPEETIEPLTFLEVLGSILAAIIGVQSSEKRKRDLTRGKAIHFIFVGILCTATFVFAMILFVQWVLTT